MAGPVWADTTIKDVLVAVRTFSFVSDPPTGTINLAVLYDPGNPVSVADLKTIETALNSHNRPAPAALRPVPVPVPVADLSRLTRFRFAFITSGVGRFMPALIQQTRGRGLLTVSADLDCVHQGLCVMGIAAEPRVEIVISHSAAQLAGIVFDPTFIMMITER